MTESRRDEGVRGNREVSAQWRADAQRRRQREGAHVKTIAHEVGVAPWTLALWLRTPASATLRAVDVVPDVPATSAPVHLRPVLITPQGLRVEGLDPDTLVAVLRALG